MFSTEYFEKLKNIQPEYSIFRGGIPSFGYNQLLNILFF